MTTIEKHILILYRQSKASKAKSKELMNPPSLITYYFKTYVSKSDIVQRIEILLKNNNNQ